MKYLSVILLATITAAVLGQRSKPSPKHDDRSCDPSVYGKYPITSGNGYENQVFNCVADPADKTGHKGRWTLDADASKRANDEMWKMEAHRAELAASMTTRVLTDSEYKEVLAYGWMLLVQNGQLYYEDEVRKDFEYRLRIQDELRLQKLKEAK